MIVTCYCNKLYFALYYIQRNQVKRQRHERKRAGKTDGLITEIEKAPTVIATNEAKDEAKTILDFMARKGVVSEAWVTAARAYIAIFAGQHIDAINARRRSLTQPKISLVG